MITHLSHRTNQNIDFDLFSIKRKIYSYFFFILSLSHSLSLWMLYLIRNNYSLDALFFISGWFELLIWIELQFVEAGRGRVEMINNTSESWIGFFLCSCSYEQWVFGYLRWLMNGNQSMLWPMLMHWYPWNVCKLQWIYV